MVFLQAMVNDRRPAFACFEAVRDGTLILFISPEIEAEVLDVFGRDSIRRKFRRLTPEVPEHFWREVRDVAVMVREVPRAFRLTRDPKDEPYIDLAIAAGASYLVTRDNDLLDLMDDPGFREQCPGLDILDPVALLRQLGPPA